MYFNDERPVLGAKGGFAKPSDDQIKDCPGYNNYRYGLEHLNPYMQTVGPDRLRTQYIEREVVYLLGSEDKDPNHPGLSKNCESMLQGNQRLERGTLYFAYLRHFFGPELVKHHRMLIVPGSDHNSRKMFNSPIGVQTLFETMPVRTVKHAAGERR